MDNKIAKVNLHWLPLEKGGRKEPFVGDLYATTARFVGEKDYFSVVLRFPLVSNPSEGELTLLAPDKLPHVQRRLEPGCELEITEGPRMVANCHIVSLKTLP